MSEPDADADAYADDGGEGGDGGKGPGRRPVKKKDRQLYRSAAEHHLLEGLPDDWQLEAVPRGAGTKHVDYYWISPPDPFTGRPKRLRSMNEVRSYLNPETIMKERSKRIDHDREQVKKVLDLLISKVERRYAKAETRGPSGLGGRGRGYKPLIMRHAADIMREPLSAFVLYGLEQHLNLDPTGATAQTDARELARAYGEQWLEAGAEVRAPFEQMASLLEATRCSALQARQEARREALKQQALTKEIAVRSDEGILADAVAAMAPGTGRYAPGASSYGGSSAAAGKRGRGGGRGRGAAGGGAARGRGAASAGRGRGRGQGRGRGRGGGRASRDADSDVMALPPKKQRLLAAGYNAPTPEDNAARREAKASRAQAGGADAATPPGGEGA